MPLLIKESDGKRLAKEIKLLDQKKIRSIGSTTIKILKELAKEGTYSKELAARLGLHEQKIYYHLRKLEQAGLIKLQRKERKRGAICKFWEPKAEAFGLNLSTNWRTIAIKPKSWKICQFFSEFIQDEVFNGSIVVGSPQKHGPFMTASRDGHYAIQLAAFLGSLSELDKRFIVKLDTEAKAGGALDQNLILIGGPITNIISMDLNDKLQVNFKWERVWKISSAKTGKEYSGEALGILSKIKEDSWARIFLAGLDFKGTKACIMALTQNPKKVLADFERDKEFYRVIKGLDRDGDGKIDSIDILE